jgi:hypothetical protein
MKNKTLKFNPDLTAQERIKLHYQENSKYSALDLIELGDDPSDFGPDWVLVSDLPVDHSKEVLELAEELSDNYSDEDFPSTGFAFSNANSEQDTEDVRIRYRYSGNKDPERTFCVDMMGADKIYRKEDILKMGNHPVNPGFGMRPTPEQPYSIWLWKGGGLMSEAFPQGTCKHLWRREIYENQSDGRGGKGTQDVKSPLANTIGTRAAIAKGYKIESNPIQVARTPHNMK